MGQTHPNAYLADAAAKREQAKQLLQEAETLEGRAVELGGELPRPKSTEDDPVDSTDSDEPSGPEDATSDDDEGSEDSAPEDDPHSRRKRGRR